MLKPTKVGKIHNGVAVYWACTVHTRYNILVDQGGTISNTIYNFYPEVLQVFFYYYKNSLQYTKYIKSIVKFNALLLYLCNGCYLLLF